MGTNGNGNGNWRPFYASMFDKYGYDQEKVTSILKTRYDGFDATKTDEYEDLIMSVWEKEGNELRNSLVARYSKYVPETCPVCNKKAEKDPLGWTCDGSRKHALLWREATIRLRPDIVNLIIGWITEQETRVVENRN